MKAPWHIWVVGIAALFWNMGGAVDYIMVQFQVQSYMAMMTEGQRQMFTDYPAWFSAAWAFGVWGAVVGSLLLMLKNRLAVFSYGISLAGLIVASVWSFGLADPPAHEVMGPMQAVFSAAIFVVLALLVLYSRWLHKRGVLT